MKQPCFAFGILALFYFSGCSLFFGSIRPVEEKSNNYTVSDLAEGSSEWSRIDTPKGALKGGSVVVHESTHSDIAFQSNSTSSIISISSVCRMYPPSSHVPNLLELTRELLFGVTGISQQESVPITVDETPALQTTTLGQLEKEEMKVRTVVLEKDRCVFDLMYIARPDRFPIHEKTFSQFVSSLRVR